MNSTLKNANRFKSLNDDSSQRSVAVYIFMSVFFLFWTSPAWAISSITQCFPKCTVEERKRAVEYLQIELNRIEPRVASLEKRINGLRNDLSVTKFNSRRAETGVKITTTRSDTLLSNTTLGSQGFENRIQDLETSIQEKEDELFSFKSEVSLLQSELEAFLNLTPAEAGSPATRTISNGSRGSGNDAPGLKIGEDAYYDDQDDLKFLIGDYYALLIGISEYKDLGINDLVQPAKDVQDFMKVLRRDYNFLEQNLHIY